MSVYNFLVSGPKFTKVFSSIRGGNVVDQVLFRFSISRSVPEIFAIKVGSCVKSVQILHVFVPPKFFRGGLLEFLDRDYLIGVDSDSVVKFRGDWPSELGDHVSD